MIGVSLLVDFFYRVISLGVVLNEKLIWNFGVVGRIMGYS